MSSRLENMNKVIELILNKMTDLETSWYVERHVRVNNNEGLQASAVGSPQEDGWYKGDKSFSKRKGVDSDSIAKPCDKIKMINTIIIDSSNDEALAGQIYKRLKISPKSDPPPKMEFTKVGKPTQHSKEVFNKGRGDAWEQGNLAIFP
ncbi:Zinc finger protein 45 [Sesbania bispinosa]|nr:Zinc finger protein 45 [Sesbania bispinosa]